MAAPTLQAEKRTEVGGTQLDTLREQGIVPGVVYGPKQKKNQLIKVGKLAFEKLYDDVGESMLVDVVVDGKELGKGLIYDVQINPLTREPSHIDIFLVDMTKELEVEVELKFVGVAPAVKELGGTLIKTRDYIDVTCLPENLVDHIKVRISSLKTFDDIIRLQDLDIPEGLVTLDKPEMTIAKVEAPRSEEELAALDEEVAEDIEGVEVETEEGEEGEEGEAPEDGEKAPEGEGGEAPAEEAGEAKEASKE